MPFTSSTTIVSPFNPKRPCVVLIACAFLLTGCTASVQTTDDATPPPADTWQPVAVTVDTSAARPLPHPVAPPPPYQQAIEQGTRSLTGAPGPNHWQQQPSYTLEARLFPDEKRLEGTARIAYTNNSPQALRQVRLELAQNLHAEGTVRREPAEVTGGVRISRVTVDGQALATDVQAPPGYLVGGTQLLVAPPSPVPSGETIAIEIDWSFIIPQAGAGARMGYNGDDFFYLAYWYPAMAVYDDVYGWFTDPFTGQAEFYHEFADYDLTIEAPAGWIVMATGTLQNPDDVLAPAVAERMRQAHASDTPVQVVGPEDFGTATQTGDRLRWHFTAEQVRDVAFSATRSSIWEAARTPVGDRDGDGQTDYTAINTFYRASAPLWDDVTRYQQHSLTFFSEYTGFPYPWPHMTAVEGGGIIGGGMEFPMMTLMGDYNARGDSALYYVTAHELAHMWIPMIVGTNERRYSWIDEGATSFLENQARFDFYPGSDHDDGDRQNYINVARAGLEGELMRWSDFHYPGPAFGIASYSKPATLLVALRGVLGKETFQQAYRTFIDRWAFKHPYPWDLFNTFEEVSDRDLDWFWSSWYYESWTLDQAVAAVNPQDGQVEIIIEDEGLVPMPVLLRITFANGTTSQVKLPVDTWLGGATSTSVVVRAPAAVTRVEIDPEQHFPDIDRSNNVWTP